DVDAHRAAGNAGRLRALQATGGLGQCPFLVEAVGHLREVAATLGRRTVDRLLARHSHPVARRKRRAQDVTAAPSARRSSSAKLRLRRINSAQSPSGPPDPRPATQENRRRPPPAPRPPPPRPGPAAQAGVRLPEVAAPAA